MKKNKKQLLTPFQEAKRDRMVWLADFLSKNIPTDYSKVVALIETKFGLSNKKARQYIQSTMSVMDLVAKDGQIVKGEG